MKAVVVSYKNNQLGDCLAQNEFLFKLACLCDIFILNERNSICICKDG